jgi:putative oxidoreductase
VSPIRRLARPMLAGIFITGGIDSLRHPAPRAELVAGAGLTSPEQLVRANAAAQIGGGLMLATSRLPRVAALVLAGSLIPTTYVGHPFWQEKDKVKRKQQQVHFLKNLSTMGGLLLAVADTGGRESLPHAAGRVSRSVRKDAARTAHKTSKRASKAAAKAHKALPVAA